MHYSCPALIPRASTSLKHKVLPGLGDRDPVGTSTSSRMAERLARPAEGTLTVLLSSTRRRKFSARPSTHDLQVFFAQLPTT